MNGLRPRVEVDAVRVAGSALHDLLLTGLPNEHNEHNDLNMRLQRFLTDVPWRLLDPERFYRSWVNPGVPLPQRAGFDAVAA
ncbi:MAG: hypothetical protein R2710_25620 [Acidimicrobiales bacterium]